MKINDDQIREMLTEILTEVARVDSLLSEEPPFFPIEPETPEMEELVEIVKKHLGLVPKSQSP